MSGLRWSRALVLIAFCLVLFTALLDRPAAADRLGPGGSEQSSANSAPPAVSPEGYENILWSVLREVQAAQNGPAQDRPAHLAEAQRLVRSVALVTLPSGEQVKVDNEWLITELSQKQPALETIAQRLRGLIAELHEVRLARPQNWPTDPDSALQKVLAQPQYQWDQPVARDNSLARFFESIRSWFGARANDLRRQLASIFESLVDWLDKVFGGIGLPGPDTPGMTWPVYAVGILVVVGFVLLLIWTLRRHSASRALLKRAAAPEDDVTTMAQAFDRANELAKSGDYRQAIRALYLAALLYLHEKQLVHYDRTMTNREHLRAVRSNQLLYDRLRPLVLTFDQVWYGHRPPTVSDFEAFRQGVDGLRRSVD